MNARQKAKKLKREIEHIKNQPVRNIYKVINVEAEHLRVFRIFSFNLIESVGEEMVENEARIQLSNELLKYIRENIIVNKYRDKDVMYSTDIWLSFGKR